MLNWCRGPNVTPEEISFLCQMSALWNLHISLWFYSGNWLWDNEILFKTFSALRPCLQPCPSNNHTTFLLLSEAAWGAQRDFSPPLVLCHPWGSSFSSHSKNGCSCSCVHSWCTWECLHSKWASNTDLHSLREVVLLPSSHALTLELPACVWHALRVMIDGSQGGCLDLKLFDWNCWEKRYVELSRIFLGNWVNSIQKPLRGNKCGTTQCHLSKATLQSTLHIQPPSSAVCTFHWLRNVCNVAILFKSLQTSLIKEAELHRVLSSCFGDRAGAFPLEVTFKGTKVHLFFISTAQLKHFTLSWV